MYPLLHSQSLPLQITLSSLAIGAKKSSRRRRRTSTIGSSEITAIRRAFSFAASLRNLFPLTDPFGGNGGGGLGFPTGGPGGDWFRRGKGKGSMGLIVSLALGLAIWGFGKNPEWELGVRVLVPVVLAFKVTVWRRWIMVLILASALYVGRTREGGRNWAGWGK